MALLFIDDKFNIKIPAKVLIFALIVGAIGSTMIAIHYKDLSKLQSFLSGINVMGMGKDKEGKDKDRHKELPEDL